MFSKEASEGGRLEEKGRSSKKRKDEAVRSERTGKKEEKERSGKKGKDKAARRERAKRKDPLVQITNNLFLKTL